LHEGRGRQGAVDHVPALEVDPAGRGAAVTAAGGTELTSAAIAKFEAWRLPSCAGGTAEDLLEPAELSTGGTVLRYDATGGQFIQNWQTPKGTGSDLCYRATVTTKDGSTITAFFKVRK
jgi:hypothetical protein